MSENMIATLNVMNKEFIINWPFSQTDVGCNPHYANAIQVNAEGNIDYFDYVVANIYPEEGTTFTTAEQVINLAHHAILAELVINLLAGNHATAAQRDSTAHLVETWTDEQLTEILHSTQE